MLRVSIEDTGTGIDPSNIDRVFKPFFTTKANGMGMGLVICRSIIEKHDGRIWVSPRTNGASTLQFELTCSVILHERGKRKSVGIRIKPEAPFRDHALKLRPNRRRAPSPA